ncbi:MAG: GNAT family N-acetyltransferase [Kofleriaceae bacterium]|nr:GNAT family N-acetyltransferase [Kofleriaceae bacterium]
MSSSTLQLQARASLPRKPVAPTLCGQLVTLRPLRLPADLTALHANSCGAATELGDRKIAAYDADALIWRYMFAGPFADAAELGTQFLQPQADALDGTPLCVEIAGQPVGVYNILSHAPEHWRMELGSIWYSPVVQRSGCNDEATWLVLDYLFALGYRRVEWKCHADNWRSRAAALAMGFLFEGLFESHMLVKGQNRDTAWYRMLDRDWPRVRPMLAARVATKLAAAAAEVQRHHA